MSNTKNIEGSRDLGARLHQWHSGMDAVYALGSMFYAGHPVDKEQVQDAIEVLERVFDRANFAGPGDGRELRALIAELHEALDDPETFNLRQSGALDDPEEVSFRDRLARND